MKIDILMWSNIVVTHSDTSYKDMKMENATINFKDNSVSITEYCENWSTGKSVVFTKAKVVELTSTSLKVEAEYFSYSFITKETKTHTVSITAEF